MDFSFLTSLVSADKVGGWVRAAVASLIGVGIAKWPLLGQVLDSQTQAALGVAAAGVAVGVWSHVAKMIADKNAAKSSEGSTPAAPKTGGQ